MPAESQQPPYRAYATIMGTFLAGLGAVSGLAAVRDRPLQRMSAIDLTLLGLATFKASRTVARDKVTSFVREPFVEGEADSDHEQPTHDTELKQAIGELVTCTRCVGTWIGASARPDTGGVQPGTTLGLSRPSAARPA